MRVNCPNCQSIVELADDTSLSNIWCPSCKSTFQVSDEETLELSQSTNIATTTHRLPKKIGRFQLLKLLGQGTLSEVWKARNAEFDQLVALKLPSKNYSHSTFDRFLREAETLSRLSHPNIAAVHKWGVEDGQPYIVTDLIEGKTLSDWRKSNAPTPRQSAKICQKIAIALFHAHSRNVVHRDLKPSNIMVDANDEPHIVDFGLAILDTELDDTGVLVGTPGYMAPEQINGHNVKVDSRADIYSLGVILYELLTGLRPHSGNRLFTQVTNEIPRPPRELNPGIPKDLECICLKCLQKEPSDRYVNAHDVAKDIDRFLVGVHITAGKRTSIFRRVSGQLVNQLNQLSIFLLTFLLVALIPFIDQNIRLIIAAIAATLAAYLWYFFRISHKSNEKNGSLPNTKIEAEVQRLASLNETFEQRLDQRTRMFHSTQEELELYQSLLESLPVCVYRKDLQGRFSFVNDFFCKTVGSSLEYLTNGTSKDVFTEELAEKHKVDEANVVRSKQVTESTEKIYSNGETIIFDVLKSPVRNFNGDVVGVQCLMWDVSSHTKAEQALRDAKDLAEAANRGKTSFLANISHELRTPLTAIIGVTEILAESKLSDRPQSYVNMIQESGDSLLRIINDLLDLAKIEAGKLHFEDADFNLNSSLESIVTTLSVKPDAGKNVTISFEFDQQIPEILCGDAARLRQVILNLAVNALKFTEQGEIKIKAALKERCNDQLELLFQVSDTGIGIPSDKIDKIFRPFEQADTSSSGGYGGTGLGLPIASGIVQEMGGEIWAESELNIGSSFFFTVILRESQKTKGERKPDIGENVSSCPLCILLVDDVPTNQFLIEHHLESQGHRIVLADSGTEALKHVETQKFDLILMDVQMPGIDGFETTKRIRENEKRTGAHVPIIAMTARAMVSDREHCLEVGMDGYVSKPIDWNELNAVINKHVKTPASLEELASKERLLDRVNGDRVFLEKLIKSFVDQSSSLLSDVLGATRSDNQERWQKSVHKLKGAFVMFLGEERIPIIERLELSSRSDRLEHLEDETRDLETQMKRLKNRLTEILGELNE